MPFGAPANRSRCHRELLIPDVTCIHVDRAQVPLPIRCLGGPKVRAGRSVLVDMWVIHQAG